jgi:hypothetical protein
LKGIRPAAAIVSISFCILAISVSFNALYGQVYQPSPLLNTNMKFWTLDPVNNLTRPYLWQVDIIKGSLDNVSISQFNIASRPSIALRVERNNQNNTLVWTTVHVRQDLSGQGVDAIFRSAIGLWVFPTFTYWYDSASQNPESAFGVEINDGTNLLWFIFADEPSQVFELPHHRIVLVQSPLNTWSLREVDVSKQYDEAGWKRPENLSFILLLGTTRVHPGNWVGYFSGLSVNVSSLQTESLSSSQRMVTLALDGMAIIAITVVAVNYDRQQGIRRLRRAKRKLRSKGERLRIGNQVTN